jgi:hypothetical protein
MKAKLKNTNTKSRLPLQLSALLLLAMAAMFLGQTPASMQDRNNTWTETKETAQDFDRAPVAAPQTVTGDAPLISS